MLHLSVYHAIPSDDGVLELSTSYLHKTAVVALSFISGLAFLEKGTLRLSSVRSTKKVRL